MKGFPPQAKMHFPFWMAFLHFGIVAVQSQPTAITINKVVLKAEPAEIRNGDNLTLTCTAEISKAPGTGLLRPVFMFYKQDVLLYNTTSAMAEALYNISPARFSHSGFYMCAVQVNEKNRNSEELTIKVKGVSPPKISVSKTEVKEGEEVTVHCEASEEKAPIVFKFFKIKDTKERQEKTRMANTINYAEVIFPVEEGDKNLHFECTAELTLASGSETSPASSRQLVTVSEPFSTPAIIVKPSTNITEGDHLTVNCTTVASSTYKERHIEILIQKGKTILAIQKDSTSASYAKDLAVIADEGNYTCKAESGLASKSNSVYIHVTELFPRPTLTVLKEISEGDNVLFSCHVSGFRPQNLTFFLEKNNSTINKRMINIENMENTANYSKASKESDSGFYECSVTIRNITKKSDPKRVTVYAPVSMPFLAHTTKISEVVVGQTLILTCRAERGTPPITYTLSRGTERLGNITVKTKGEAAIFKLHVTTLSHFEGYRCKAENKNKVSGLLSNILTFTVIAPVQRVILKSIPPDGEVENGKDLTLMCHIINGSWPVEFRFYRTDRADYLHQEIVNKSTALWHQSTFIKEQEGSYYCTASNRANLIKSNIVGIKVILASWKKAIIAVFVVLIVAGISATLIWWYLQKKRKAKQITVEMSRPTAVANSYGEKPPQGQINEAESHYPPGFNEDGENHSVKPAEEKKDAGENDARIEGRPDAT